MPWMLLLLFVAFVASCGQIAGPTPDEIRPGQLEAMDFVWHTVYGMPEDVPPPPIDWVDGEQCKDLPIRSIPIQKAGGIVCAAGFYWNGRITLVRATLIQETALAHEYMHAMLEYVTGDTDGAHKRPEWTWISFTNDRLSTLNDH